MKAKTSPGRKRGGRVRLQEIAEYCELSRITVSCALRGDRKNVSQATIERVVAAARKLGYDPAMAHAARRLRYLRSGERVVNHLAALFFPFSGIHERYWALIFEGLQSLFGERQFGSLSCTPRENGGRLRDQLPFLFHRGDVDGAIVFATEQYREALIATLREEPGFRGRPIVTLTESFPGCSAVLVDDFQVGYQAAGHLLDMGHRHLLCFESKRYTSEIVRQRLAGYRQACVDRRIDPVATLHKVGWVWDDKPGLATAFPAALRAHPDVTGILCPNDGFGIPLVRLLKGMGHRVPHDISVIGVDDCEELPDAEGNNTWTTVRIPLQDLGRAAAELLLDRVTGKLEADETRTIPVSLVVRGTTCPPRGSPAA